MFTKLGRKLVPIAVPERNDVPQNSNSIPNSNEHNGQVQNILDLLLSKDGPMIDSVATPIPKEDNSPSECSILFKSPTAHNTSAIVANNNLTTDGHNTVERFFSRSKIPPIQEETAEHGSNVFDDSIKRSDAVKECFVPSYAVFSKSNHLSTAKKDKTKLNKLSEEAQTNKRTPSKNDTIQTEETRRGSNVFDDSRERISAANECFVPNYEVFSEPNQLPTEHMEETIPTKQSKAHAVYKTASYKIQKPQQGKNVLGITERPQFLIDSSAKKAKDIPIVPSIRVRTRLQHTQSSKSRTPPEDPSKDKLPLNEVEDITLHRKIVNGTEYVPYTIKTNVIQRERKIQVDASIKKETRDTAVQYDLIEDTDVDEDEAEDEDQHEDSKKSQSDWINDIIEEYENADMYECHICGEVCPSRSSNLKHSLMHTVGCSLLCFRCGSLFPNTSRLLAHEDKMHAEKQLEIKKALRCPKINCLKAFHSKRQLFDHIDLHSTKMSEQRCTRCQRSFATSLQLLCHTNRRSCLR